MKPVQSLLATSLLGFSAAFAQSLSCSETDEVCMSRELGNACREQESTYELCLAWVSALENSAVGAQPIPKRIAASGYLDLARMAENRAEGESLRARAERIYWDLLAEYPEDVHVRVGMLQFVDTREQRIGALREIVAIDPNYIYGWEALASAVARSDESDDLIEAAQYLERVYQLRSPGPGKWEAAANVVVHYRQGGASGQAAIFADRVKIDYGLEAKLIAITNVQALGSEEHRSILNDICGEWAITVFGPLACQTGIASTVQLVNQAPAGAPAVAAAEDAANAMVLAAQRYWRLDDVIPQWRPTFLRWLDELVNSGKSAPSIHVAYARITTNKEMRLARMQEAARLAPADGDIAVGLVLAYRDLGRRREASAELARARELLSEEGQQALDRVLQQLGEGSTDN